jgi:hypothetical protein
VVGRGKGVVDTTVATAVSVDGFVDGRLGVVSGDKDVVSLRGMVNEACVITEDTSAESLVGFP